MADRNTAANDNQQTPPRDAALIAAARQQAAALDESDLRLDAPPAGNGFTAPPPDSFAGYRIIKEVHRGGQGVVYQAIQESTSRKVAIKVMRQGPFTGSSDRARFDREVQVLGQLNHANIVSIHDRGTAAGCEYFVMDYISGQPLDVYMASGRRTIDDSLRLFLNICDAINAAHLHGVIHRDIKPSNIRIDAEGRPHILDFGLAKTMGSVGVPPANQSIMTITGQFIGSLPWASPEQAEAIPAKIDIRTDVYSLGVVLYQMLTGKFPYEVVGNMRDVLGRIINEAPQRPRTVRREMNDEVETIILKCLAKEPERRYQSAGELAKDVERYLTGDPIEAKRDSAAYVLRKQLRKHKLPVAVAAAFLTVVFAGLAASLTFWQQAVYERDRAEANFQKARDAVNQMLSEVGNKDLANVPQMETLRKTLLQRAVTSYEGFLTDESADATVRYEAVNAYESLARINANLGYGDQSEQAYRQAMILLGALQERHPDEPKYRFSAAAIQGKLGQFCEAISGLELLVESFPDNPEYRDRLAGTLGAQGVELWRQIRLDEAEALLRRAVALLEALVKEFPEQPGYHSTLGKVLHNLNLVIDQPRESRELHERAIVHLKAALELDPGNSDYQKSLDNLGANLDRGSDVERAEQIHLEKVRTKEEQAAKFPHTPALRFDVARELGYLSTFLRSHKRFEQARDASDRAVTVYQELIAEFPDVVEYRKQLAIIRGNLALILRLLGADEQGEDQCRQARDLFQRLVEQDSASPRVKHALALAQLNLGDFASDRGGYTEADRAVRQAHGLWSELLASFPDSDTYRRYLALASRELADFSSSAIEPTIVNVAEALKFAQQSVELAPHDAKCWRALGAASYRAGDYPAAVAPLEKAIELRGRDANAFEWFFLAMTRWQLGDKEQARELYDRAVEWTQQNQPQNEQLRRLRTEAAELLGIKQ